MPYGDMWSNMNKARLAEAGRGTIQFETGPVEIAGLRRIRKMAARWARAERIKASGNRLSYLRGSGLRPKADAPARPAFRSVFPGPDGALAMGFISSDPPMLTLSGRFRGEAYGNDPRLFHVVHYAQHVAVGHLLIRKEVDRFVGTLFEYLAQVALHQLSVDRLVVKINVVLIHGNRENYALRAADIVTDGPWKIHVYAPLEERRRNHEDDQKNQHYVD